MGIIAGFADSVILLFSVLLLVVIPLLDAQLVLPAGLYPKRVAELKKRQEEDNGDYLMRERHAFFVGLVWAKLFLQWPLCVAVVYGVLAKTSWIGTPLVMLGASNLTSMAAIMGELLGSRRASEKFVLMCIPFVLFSILAILRGFFLSP